jgi:peptidoglycan/LPS O-acetylase OafA/YrhL
MKRLGYLDGLRGLAALWVLLHHVWFTAWSGHRPPRLAYAVWGWIAGGSQAVPMFIVLSGFCLALAIKQGKSLSPGKFYLRRAWRILPPYYLSIVVSLFALIWIGQPTGGYWDMCVPVTMVGIWQHLLLVHDLTRNWQINHVYWSIAVEWRIYLLFPLLVFLWRRGYHLALVGLILSLSLLEPYLLYFVLGCGAALSPRSVPKRVALGLLIVWVPLCAVYLSGRVPIPGFVPRLVTSAVTASWLTRLLYGEAEALKSFLEMKRLRWLGAISYSLYLTHAPILELIWRYVLRPMSLSPIASFYGLAVLATGAGILFAWGFYWMAERPFLKRPWEARAV